jgi:hypothetical protein
MMRFTYRITRDGAVYVAECVETDAAGEGKTADDAVRSLRTSLEERMFRPDAVAPPANPARAPIELLPANDAEETDLSGPGDARPISGDAKAGDGRAGRP